MPRPKLPPPIVGDLTLTAWELAPELMAATRALAGTPGMGIALTVLTSERPTATGAAPSLDYASGYEACLSLLRRLVKGQARERAGEQPEPTYESSEIADTLNWKH